MAAPGNVMGSVYKTSGPVIAGFVRMLEKACQSTDIEGRKLVCTPCGGNYGEVAAWLIAVNGSPPRAMVLIGQEAYCGSDDVFLIVQEKSKRLGAAQAKICRTFQEFYLSPRACKLDGKLPRVIVWDQEE